MRTLAPQWEPRPSLVGHRHAERWVVNLLDDRDRLIRELDRVEAGSLDYSIHTAIRSSGSLRVADPALVDWHRVRLGIGYTYRDEAGVEHDHPLGVFLPTTPKTQHSNVGPTADVAIYDKMSLLSTDLVATTWTVDAGTTVVDAVTEVLASVGETRISAPSDGGGELSAPMVWSPGEEASKLRVVNDILEAGNFFSIWVDGTGRWRLDPYVAPGDRSVEWRHIEGANAIFEDEFEHEADGWAIPNEVIIVGRTERDEDGEDLPAPFAVAQNTNPDDPFSIPGRGRVISHREEDQDATTEQVLGQIAARRLLELSSVTSTYSIAHAWLPMDLNAATELVVPSAGIDALTVLQAWSWSWSADSVPDLVSATLREVAR